MKPKLKPIARQVIVITGASSGIGLATAQMAAKAGARLVLVARNAEALQQLDEDLTAQGAQVRWVAADVADEEALRKAVSVALQAFGALDTWINNAGVSVFGYNEQVSREDQRRVFETNFWGVVNGSVIALEHLRVHGGALINVGSELSDSYAPLQGIYTASKHAVKAFTESLRAELEHDNAPVSVTLIKPAAIATMFIEHAKNYMDVEAKLPTPLYAPELVAETILMAAETPQRELFVGGAAKLMSLSSKFAPNFVARLLEQSMFARQRSDRPESNPDRNSLYNSQEDLHIRGNYTNVQETSPYTTAAMHPRRNYALIGGGAIAVAVLLARRRYQRAGPELH